MGKIHVLPEQVANKIAAGEVVERPASVVKELLENALDAGARRVRIAIEGGGKKLIQITDDGCGMVRDDALLAFERHATSKIRTAEDLLTVATLGFRGEALPSIASVSRLRLETCARAENPPAGAPAATQSGTVIEIAGGKFLSVQEAGLPFGTAITVRDLFFNLPARRKFLRSEATELSQIASLVTHYALAHPEMHFELHSASNAMLQAPPVTTPADRVYQIFGKETLDQLIPVAAMVPLERVGLPQPPPWRRVEEDPAEGGRSAEERDPGELRLHGFVSKPEIQKLNRNSIFVFVNGRLIRDRLVQHALTEAYRNIIPPTVFPVVLLFLEMPCAEVDVNVHPSKTEVRFRQQSIMHDFVRDSVRAALMKSRPVPHFTNEIASRATAGSALSPGADVWGRVSDSSSRLGEPGHTAVGELGITAADAAFVLRAPEPPPITERIAFSGGFEVEANAAIPVARFAGDPIIRADDRCAPPIEDASAPEDPRASAATHASLGTLRALGQVRDSFILAVNGDGLWIVDQHAAHERVLFEQVVRQREAMAVEVQRLLMPIILEMAPAQQAIFAEICDELRANGFDAEPFGSRTIAVKTAPAGLDPAAVEGMLHELLEQLQREEQVLNLEIARRRIAASIACHAAIKVNMPLEPNKMEWLLDQLARTACPMSCPHGRPTVLRYSVKDIQKAFKRI